MKYVAVQHPVTGTIEFHCSMLKKHEEIAAPYVARGYTARSAAFLRFLPGERFETFGQSTSLGLGPHADDARMLSAFYSATLREGGYVPSEPSAKPVFVDA